MKGCQGVLEALKGCGFTCYEPSNASKPCRFYKLILFGVPAREGLL